VWRGIAIQLAAVSATSTRSKPTSTPASVHRYRHRAVKTPGSADACTAFQGHISSPRCQGRQGGSRRLVENDRADVATWRRNSRITASRRDLYGHRPRRHVTASISSHCSAGASAHCAVIPAAAITIEDVRKLCAVEAEASWRHHRRAVYRHAEFRRSAEACRQIVRSSVSRKR